MNSIDQSETLVPAVGDQSKQGFRPIAECTREDLVNNHALVYGRCKIWSFDLTDTRDVSFRWSAYAWWKAMWYSHRGPPCHARNWDIYAGFEGFTGPGDAQISHFMPMPDVPAP